jgi:very-short-patch-repair endonuclease
LVCGNPYSFQGDERDIMLLSLVAAPNERIGSFTKPADERRFNVAASRARDKMILFHSVTCDDLSNPCLRRQLLDFFENTKPQEIAGIDRDELERRAAQDNRRVVSPPSPLESWFEVDTALELLRKGFNVRAQHEVAGKQIDLVVEGGQARLALECDGDNWHGADRYEADMQRQRQLERCGWEFFRVRESAFYTNKEDALAGLWELLEKRGIFPSAKCTKPPGVGSLEGEERRTSDIDDAADSDHDDVEANENIFSEGAEYDSAKSSRRAEEITKSEIQNAILKALSKCPNHSCTLHSLTRRVLREVGVFSRGKPREEFEKRTMRCVSNLEKAGRVERYTAKNQRLKLVTEGTD